MFDHSFNVSTHNIDSESFTLANVNCTWSRWDPACVNDSILCDCNARDHDFLFLIYHFSRALGLTLAPVSALLAFPDLFDRPRIKTVLTFLSPLVYPVLRLFLPENKIIENVLFISVPSILQGTMFFYLSIMFLVTSNFISKRFKSIYAVYNYNDFHEIDNLRSSSLFLVAALLISGVGFLEDLSDGLPDLSDQIKAITSMGRRQDPLFYPNVLMIRKLVLLMQVAVIVVFAVDRVRKEVNTDLPPNLNKQILIAQIITLLTWNFGAFVTLLDLWELWPIFVFLTVAEIFLFWALAIAFYGF